MFKPNFDITSKLLANIKDITKLMVELDGKKFPAPITLKLEDLARTVSIHSSTAIEGNPIPITDIKKIIKGSPKNLRDTEKEIYNYNKALEFLDKEIRNKKNIFSDKLILKIHELIMQDLIHKKRLGRFREEAVFVNDPKKRQTIYWPPDYQEISRLMKDLVDFVRKYRHEYDPVILSGLVHKQFVVIHPFIDGNGRTTRLITKFLLADLGLDTFNLFSFENYYNQNISKYFQKVGVKGNYYEISNCLDFTEWLEYFSDGIIDELLRVRKLLLQESYNPEATLAEHHHKIIKHIEKHGFINDKIYSTITNRAKATRSLDFGKLIKMNILERHGKGRAIYYKFK
jgi:Fic family protein